MLLQVQPEEDWQTVGAKRSSQRPVGHAIDYLGATDRPLITPAYRSYQQDSSPQSRSHFATYGGGLSGSAWQALSPMYGKLQSVHGDVEPSGFPGRRGLPTRRSDDLF